jgi:hypothetical protein
MNVQACIELHNRIVKYAVDKVFAHKTVSVTRSWFAFYSEEAEEIRPNLPRDIVLFLEGVDIVDSDELSFLPVLQGLAPPSEIRCELKTDNLLTLYQSIHAESDDLGLMFDINNSVCFFLPTIDDEPDQGWNCGPLQNILKHYWERIELEKFVLNAVEAEWTTAPYSELELNTTLKSWDELVDHIIERLPVEERKSVERSEKEYGWFTEQILDQYQVVGFPRAFLLKARKPPPVIKYIAPGLRILDLETLATIMEYKQQREPTHNNVDSFLLFPSEVPFESWSSWDQQIGRAQMWDKSVMLAKKTGLYLVPSMEDTARFDDTTELLTPWPAGKANLEIFTYGPNCPFYPSHGVVLENVFDQWIDLVCDTSGFWTVGLEGLEGGMEHWKKANTAEKHMYVLQNVCR